MNQKQQIQKKQNESEQKTNQTIPLVEVEKLLAAQEKHITENIQIQMTQVRSGPTPSPAELKELKQIDKSFPDRLITMAEKEQNFRHNSTYFGQSGYILTVLGGYVIAGVSGTFDAVVGSTIAVGVSYIAYVFKTDKPNAPSEKKPSK